MADKSSTEIPLGDTPEPDAGESGEQDSSTSDSGVSRWIKNLGALVTIFLGLFGVYKTVYELNEKSKHDERTAQLAYDAEYLKYKVATDQLSDQRDGRKQTIMHEERVAQQANTRADHASLTSVIDHLFSQKEGAEGDFAVLSSYAHADRDSASIVTSAILARLYRAKSFSEVDLGFRLLANLGAESIEVVSQINRNARKVLDEVATRRGELLFSTVKAKNPSGFNPFKGDDAMGYEINNEVCATVPLDEAYVSTVVEHNIASWVYSGSVAPTSESDVSAQGVSMLVYEIDRSNIVFAELLDKYNAAPIRIDLSGTYLREAAISAIARHSNHKHLVLDSAFIETSYKDPNQPKELQAHAAIFKAAVKIGVMPTKSYDPLPTHVLGFPGYEFVSATSP